MLLRRDEGCALSAEAWGVALVTQGRLTQSVLTTFLWGPKPWDNAKQR